MKKFLFTLLALLSTSSLFTTMKAQSPDPCHPTSAYDTIAFCDGDSVLFHGHWYFLPGDYADTVYDAYGCMTIFHLHITFPTNIFPAPSLVRSSSYRLLCDGDSVWVAGNWAKQSGIYYDTLRASYGCDSIDTVFVNFYPVYQMFDTVSVCDSFLYQGKYYYSTGDYNVKYKSTLGCDSIYHLHLNVAPAYTYIQYDTTCQGTTYTFRGRTITQSGVYYDSLTTVDGCDSIYELHLTMLPSSQPNLPKSQIINLCEGQTYTYRGRTYTESGTYYDTIYSSSGCLFIDTLIVNVITKIHYDTTAYVCDENDSVLFRGNYYYTGVYTFFDPNDTTSLCPTVYTLTVIGPPNDTTFYVQDCESDLPVYLNDKAYYQSGTYPDTLVSPGGCDWYVTYVITIYSAQYNSIYDTICRGENYEFCGFNLSTAGEFTCRTKDVNGCDSIVTTLHLTLLDCDSTTALDNASLYDITLLPNPTSTTDIAYLYADFPDDQLDGVLVEVMTPTGILLNSIRPTQFPLAIPAINAPGTYFIRITTSSGATHIRKLIVH